MIICIKGSKYVVKILHVEFFNVSVCIFRTFLVCYDYLGLESGEIPEVNIKASDEYRSHPATQARLNGQAFWSASSSVEDPWIQADIGYQTYVSGVVTQDGRWIWNGNWTWERSIKVSTFSVSNDDTEVFVKDKYGEDIVSPICP